MEFLIIPIIIFVVVGMIVIYKKTMTKREFFEKYLDEAREKANEEINKKLMEINYILEEIEMHNLSNAEYKIHLLEMEISKMKRNQETIEPNEVYNFRQRINKLEDRVDKLEYDVDKRTVLQERDGSLRYEIIKNDDNDLSPKEIKRIVNNLEEELNDMFGEVE